MKNQKTILVENAIHLKDETGSDSIFLFLNTIQSCKWYLSTDIYEKSDIVVVVPREVRISDSIFRKGRIKVIRSWSGNQTRFSRIKYALLLGVHQRIVQTDSKVICVLGPWGSSHLDTIAVHDLALSWSKDFPFDPRMIMHNRIFNAVLAVVDIALDIGALGREGKPVGTIFTVGDTDNVMKHSHQAVFNPFKGYRRSERKITSSEVVESIKELSKLDGAFVISESSTVMAAGRHLDARSTLSKQIKGLGSRHRAAAGITKMTDCIAVVVSESTGRVTIFEKGHIIATLEPVISSRMV